MSDEANFKDRELRLKEEELEIKRQELKNSTEDRRDRVVKFSPLAIAVSTSVLPPSWDSSDLGCFICKASLVGT